MSVIWYIFQNRNAYMYCVSFDNAKTKSCSIQSNVKHKQNGNRKMLISPYTVLHKPFKNNVSEYNGSNMFQTCWDDGNDTLKKLRNASNFLYNMSENSPFFTVVCESADSGFLFFLFSQRFDL